MPPPKIISFLGQPCHTNLSKMQEMFFCQCHQCSPRGKKKNKEQKREKNLATTLNMLLANYQSDMGKSYL